MQSTVPTFVTAQTEVSQQLSESPGKSVHTTDFVDHEPTSDSDISQIPFPANTSTAALIHTPAFLHRPVVVDRALSDGLIPGGIKRLLGSESATTSQAHLAPLGRQFTAGSDGHDPAAPQSSALRSALRSVREGKGKERMTVNFDNQVQVQEDTEEPQVADPSEVLARTGEEVEATSAGAAELKQGVHAMVEPGDIIMKGEKSGWRYYKTY